MRQKAGEEPGKEASDTHCQLWEECVSQNQTTQHMHVNVVIN